MLFLGPFSNLSTLLYSRWHIFMTVVAAVLHILLRKNYLEGLNLTSHLISCHLKIEVSPRCCWRKKFLTRPCKVVGKRTSFLSNLFSYFPFSVKILDPKTTQKQKNDMPSFENLIIEEEDFLTRLRRRSSGLMSGFLRWFRILRLMNYYDTFSPGELLMILRLVTAAPQRGEDPSQILVEWDLRGDESRSLLI